MSFNNANTPIVYRSKLFQNSQQQASAQPNKSQQSKPVYKTFCKVCQDSGKTDKEYTSHNVRDKSGKTTCPTLLALECRNCYKKGHTVKYCKLLTVQAVQERVNPVKQEIKKTVPKNVFMVLESDGEEDGEEQEQQQEQFVLAPALNQKPALSYRRIIDQVNNPEAHAEAQAKAKAERDALLEAEREARNKRIQQSALKKCGWMDAESSDEEDDEEEEDTNTKIQSKPIQKVVVVDNSAW
jgi:hypothetical protein